MYCKGCRELEQEPIICIFAAGQNTAGFYRLRTSIERIFSVSWNLLAIASIITFGHLQPKEACC
jgi:hypothetical protein